MRPNRPAFVVEEEERVLKKVMDMDEDITIEDAIEKYASEKYKDYLKEKRQEELELQEQGIIAD